MRPHFNRSLSAHLRETEDHSRLPFHPACPVCRRDRLAGSLDGDELVSRRTQAAIAAGLLVFSAGGVPAAVASPPDEVSEGTSEVVAGGDPVSSVDFEPGGETVHLPDVAPSAPVVLPPAPDGEDDGPLEQEPVTDTPEPLVDASVDDASVEDAPEPLEDAEPVAPSEPAPSPAAAAPEPAADPAETQPQVPETQAGPQAEGGHRRTLRSHTAAEPSAKAQAPSEPAVSTDPTPAAPAAEPAAPEAAPAPSEAPVTTRLAAHRTTGRVAPGDRFHVVRQGESLWSIAAELLGDRATVARIAREVDRLWQLNEDRIGTGQPDLLFAGTRLRLR
jgi:nucleoid-associated protein YgaU